MPFAQRLVLLMVALLLLEVLMHALHSAAPTTVPTANEGVIAYGLMGLAGGWFASQAWRDGTFVQAGLPLGVQKLLVTSLGFLAGAFAALSVGIFTLWLFPSTALPPADILTAVVMVLFTAALFVSFIHVQPTA